MVTVKTDSSSNSPPPYDSVDSVSQDSPPLPSTSNSPPPPSSRSVPPRPAATNFLNESSTNYSIKGTYVLDLSLPPPPSILPPKDANGRELNLRLHTTNGSIDAIAALLHSRDVKGPALLEFTTTNGKIKACIEDEHQQHFRLRAASTNGAIKLRLPRTFHGPISIKRMNGRLVFSPEMQALVTTFSVDGQESRYFLGDYRESGYMDDESWLGDSARIEALNGRIEIAYTDEPEPEPTCIWKRFF